jgi:hypothetical protein
VPKILVLALASCCVLFASTANASPFNLYGTGPRSAVASPVERAACASRRVCAPQRVCGANGCVTRNVCVTKRVCG